MVLKKGKQNVILQILTLGRIMEGKNLCGSRIKKTRKEKGIRITDVIVELHSKYSIRMDFSALTRVENGQRGIQDYELLAISKILDVSVDWLLEGESEN
jgi:transcriptional regulator with XRE-family HTH domain